MPYQLPDGTLIRAPRKGRSFVLGGVRHPEPNLLSPVFREAWSIDVVPMPDPRPKSPEDLAAEAARKAQANRLNALKNAVVDQFDMILALFTVGRQKGLWKVTDFPLELREKAVEWRALVDDIKSNLS